MVIVGIPGPIFGIGFGCLINNLFISTIVVVSGKLLGDIITYFLVKYYTLRNKEKSHQYLKNKKFYNAFKQIVK